MKKEDVIKILKEKSKEDIRFKQLMSKEIIKHLSYKQKQQLVDKFKEKYKNDKDYVELVERFKKDIKYG